MVLKEDGRVIGDCGIFRTVVDNQEVNDLGYIIHHEFWGRGLATEGASSMLTHAFTTLKLDVIHANMAHDHIASRRVAEKIGMRFVREFVNGRNRGIRTLLFCAAGT